MITILFGLSGYAANLLEGIAETGMVELGDAQVAAYLAEKKYNGRPFFRNGKYINCNFNVSFILFQ